MSALGLNPRSFSLPQRACGPLGRELCPCPPGIQGVRRQWRPGPGSQDARQPKQGLSAATRAGELCPKGWSSPSLPWPLGAGHSPEEDAAGSWLMALSSPQKFLGSTRIWFTPPLSATPRPFFLQHPAAPPLPAFLFSSTFLLPPRSPSFYTPLCLKTSSLIISLCADPHPNDPAPISSRGEGPLSILPRVRAGLQGSDQARPGWTI